MPELRSPSGRYVCYAQGDQNFVIYPLLPNGEPDGAHPVWDEWSHDARRQETPAPEDEPRDPPAGPPPIAAPSAGGGPLIRVTDASDGMVRPVGMSYWPNINNHAGRAELFLVGSLADALTLFIMHKDRGTVTQRVQLPFTSTGEGCYFSFTDPDLLYVPQPQGLLRHHVRTGATETVVHAAEVGDAKQFHSSADGSVHSFTLGNAGAVLVRGTLRTFPVDGVIDECQIDKSGRWLLIKTTIPRGDKQHLDNVIVDLWTDQQWTIRDEDGAVGHSDMGYGYMVGEDDYADVGGAFRLWTFTDQGPVKGPIVHTMGTWAPMTRYVSHCNARPGPPDGQRLLFSSSELGLVSVTIGSNTAVTVCPSMTDVNASGGGPDVYWRQTRANIDPPGESVCFSGNMGTDRMDVLWARL